MYGPGDEDIQQYFIQTAFPSPQQVTETITALAQHGPLRRNELQRYVNVRASALERILTHLEVEGIIERSGSDFHLARQDATPDYERWAGVTAMRQAELERMKAYAHETGCLMRFIAEELDDPQPVERCGRCKNCTGAASKFQPDVQTIERAQRYLRGGKALVFAPRKRWPVKLPGKKNTVIEDVNEPGVALTNYYEDGWGQIVKIGRAQDTYGEELVDAAAEVISGHWQRLPEIIVAVPSLRRPTLVPGFAQRLAFALNLPYLTVLQHLKQHPPQTDMHNSYQQMMNVNACFGVTAPLAGESLLLVDDIADSKWTLTVLGALLQEHGSGPVFPFVLAVTNQTE
jgi:ATP-dependent DNA helicase RecQ